MRGVPLGDRSCREARPVSARALREAGARLGVRDQLGDGDGHRIDVLIGYHDARRPVDHHVAHGAEVERHHRAAGHLGLDRDARCSFRLARQEENVESREDLLHGVDVTETRHVRAEGIARDARVELAGERAVAGDDEVRLEAPRTQAREHVDRPLGSFLADEMAGEPDQHRVGSDAGAARELGARGLAIERAEPVRAPEVGHEEDRPREPEVAQLAAEVGGERERAVHATRHRRPPQARDAVKWCGEAEDALPHDRGSAVWDAGQRRHLRGRAAVREHHVGRLGSVGVQQAADRPCAGELETPSAGALVGEGGDVRVDRSVEAGRERDDTVGVTERVELGRELDRDDLRAAALAARHEMQHPHGRHGGTTGSSPDKNDPMPPDPSVTSGFASATARDTARGAVLVLPTTVSGQQGPVASWVSTAGWAAATRRVVGASWIVTPSGVVGIDDARRRGSDPALAAGAESSWRRRVPTVAKTAVKDVRQWRRARAFHVAPSGPWSGRDVAFVWQRHDLFQTAGLDLADSLGVPSVLFVPAVLVWEALERVAESPALRRATLVAAGSDLVAQQVRRLGAPAERVLVTPTGVDLDLFDGAGEGSAELRRSLGLADRFVVGWVGSFRGFHAAEQAVEAAARVDGAALLMVGDGPDRPRVERLARERGIVAVFTGTVAHTDLARHLGAMDVGLVLAGPDQVFHYSPLKLAEYMASGLPVVAPATGQLAERLGESTGTVLVAPGDADALADALVALRDDGDRRKALGTAARAAAVRDWSWDRQVERVLAALGSAA
jgi:glycosyltransferase involved in cell wall biosynthesis